MKHLIYILLLISPLTFAGWDDVYSCSMKKNYYILPSEQPEERSLQDFLLRVNKEKNSIILSEKLSNWQTTFEITEHNFNRQSVVERVRAEYGFHRLSLLQNQFTYIVDRSGSVEVMMATCDIFE